MSEIHATALYGRGYPKDNGLEAGKRISGKKDKTVVGTSHALRSLMDSAHSDQHDWFFVAMPWWVSPRFRRDRRHVVVIGSGHRRAHAHTPLPVPSGTETPDWRDEEPEKDLHECGMKMADE